MQLNFKQVDSSNWQAVVKLTVRDDQTHFVASNTRSLLQAAYDNDYIGHVQPQGIYDGDTLVGFVMTGDADEQMGDEPGTMWIVRYMIGADFQGKGYGRAGLEQIIADAKQNDEVKQMRLSYEPHNTVAQKLYASCGFVEEGIKEDWGEMVAVLKLSPDA